MSKHTPGPLRAEGSVHGWALLDLEGTAIAEGMREPDAKLFQVAPDLLALVKQAVEKCEADDEVWLGRAWTKAALDLIAKAEGGGTTPPGERQGRHLESGGQVDGYLGN